MDQSHSTTTTSVGRYRARCIHPSTPNTVVLKEPKQICTLHGPHTPHRLRVSLAARGQASAAGRRVSRSPKVNVGECFAACTQKTLLVTWCDISATLLCDATALRCSVFLNLKATGIHFHRCNPRTRRGFFGGFFFLSLCFFFAGHEHARCRSLCRQEHSGVKCLFSTSTVLNCNDGAAPRH